MKKPFIYIATLTTLLLSTGATAAISSFATTEQKQEQKTLETYTDLGEPINTTFVSNSENVFVITNPDGTQNKTFINNTINNSSEPLPLNLKITYLLDGQEITADELIGKSGHVKITFDFTPTKSYQNKFIPFLAITGLDLDTAKFKNIKIDHGKIISESDKNILLTGYAFVGVNEDLNTDFLSNSFTVTADTTNFELKDSYTFTTNELFADLDTTKLNTVDSLINSISDLGQAFDQILAGSTDLSKGCNDLAEGAKKLSNGVTDLATGMDQLAQGINQVDNGAHDLANGAAQLSDGMNQLVAFDNSVLDKVNSTTNKVTSTIQELIDKYNIDPDSELINRINTSLTEYYNTAYSAVTNYTGNIEKLSDGANQLKNGANQLAAGTSELKNGANQLTNGANQLANGANDLTNGANQLTNGAHILNNGLTTFKQQGINKLINFAENDLTTFISNLRSTVNAAKSYHHYSNKNAKSVKFIFKTPSLKNK